jgi:hypothetical protein
LLHEVARKAWCKMIDVTSTFGGNKEVATNSRIISPLRMENLKVTRRDLPQRHEGTKFNKVDNFHCSPLFQERGWG